MRKQTPTTAATTAGFSGGAVPNDGIRMNMHPPARGFDDGLRQLPRACRGRAGLCQPSGCSILTG
eukprot:scaffold25952_cov101-Isochrysis_galbana.AAC.2